MGESKTTHLKVGFDRQTRLQLHGAKVPSDAGLLAVRKLDRALGLTELAGRMLVGARSGHNVQHGQVGLFRQAVYRRLRPRIIGSSCVAQAAVYLLVAHNPSRLPSWG